MRMVVFSARIENVIVHPPCAPAAPHRARHSTKATASHGQNTFVTQQPALALDAAAVAGQ